MLNLNRNMLGDGCGYEHANWDYSAQADWASVGTTGDGLYSDWSNTLACTEGTGGSNNLTVLGLRAEICRFVDTYPDGWDGSGSFGGSLDSGEAIQRALDNIPSGLVLPRVMLSREGEIGLYWDFDNDAYADLVADNTGCLSFFSRSVDGREYFEDIPITEVNTAWYWSRVGNLASLSGKHAA